MRACAGVVAMLLLTACPLSVGAPDGDAGMAGASDVGTGLDAGPSADAQGAPSACQSNDECWFGAGCFAGQCTDPEVFVGRYERRPITNDWHRVTVAIVDRELMWGNEANVDWPLVFREGGLWTTDECPYDAQELGVEGGVGAVSGLRFLGELYVRLD